MRDNLVGNGVEGKCANDEIAGAKPNRAGSMIRPAYRVRQSFWCLDTNNLERNTDKWMTKIWNICRSGLLINQRQS